METLYISLIVLLFLLAIADLVVGVSNDADGYEGGCKYDVSECVCFCVSFNQGRTEGGIDCIYHLF